MEEWKDIIGYEGFYQISNTGKIKSLSRKKITAKGNLCFSKERILKFGYDKDGYHQVCLWKNNKPYNRKVHRLVGIHFIPNPNNLPQINHKNGDKKNNHVENLEWCDSLYNNRHARNTGLNTCFGQNHYRSKLTEIEVIKIRSLKGKMLQTEIAKLYNMKPMAISKILNYKTWKHLI